MTSKLNLSEYFAQRMRKASSEAEESKDDAAEPSERPQDALARFMSMGTIQGLK